ncbi:hemolysin [Erwinia sp. OLTSP20]|uniref:putative hemolysin n=1 Tax=unclassified Erwinia TaxID=2622719 RepID=UPI000C17EF7C|nr:MULTISPECIES: DUF333 domain-containing protein [unclassified Erwinia]PIJ51778.1 hemolysin [Erwinia sp. OAMSP11]PIJ74367.1 hemolysin [Erwinia sp. OLSSP12]PIJ83800.1 hemolysin [Erwinia sp. OLCASP19]PIJ86843.1 hemolysin [Erwinia sp. OLMTSP26]PIJ88250.1 hemolysin [Erwinia sp. OLMDSP33]
MKKTILLLSVLTVTSCSATQQKPEKLIGMPNPASVYCQQVGGKSIMVDTAKGVVGKCILPSGEEVDEWALYRQAHQQHKPH